MVESARNAPNTTAGDLDVIYAVGKALDPNSVVREGELNLVLKTGSPLERVLGQMGYIVGQGRLSPQQRQKLLNMLDNRVGELGRQYGAARTTYEKAADANGLPKDQIFVDIPREAAAGGGGAPNRAALIQEAKDAIARGAPQEAVRKRLESMGVTDSGL